MFEREFDIATLISLHQKGELDHNVRKKMDDWLAEDPANQILLNEFMQEDQLHSKFAKFRAIDQASGWQKVIKGVSQISAIPEQRRNFRLWPYIAIAAAIAAIVFGVGLFYYGNVSHEPADLSAHRIDIAPGKYGATLTLANGNQINLTDSENGELAKEAGISIKKTVDGQVVYKVDPTIQQNAKTSFNTLATAKGQTYILILPDKSKVWMNAASSLTYSTGLNIEGNREVRLSGEAYFEVAKDRRHPFIVKTDRQEVKVLGTHFNVNSYNDEPETITTLLEGSIKINNSKILKPGEQANLDKQGKLVVSLGSSDAISWKEGSFSFKDTDLEVVLRQLSRWYDVDIEYPDGIPNMRFTGYIDRKYTLSEALWILKYLKINFKIKDRTIIVNK